MRSKTVWVREYLLSVLSLALLLTLILTKPAQASPYIYNTAISANPLANNSAPIVTGNISPEVQGILILFHNTSYTDNSHDYTVSVSNISGSTFTTANDPFSPMHGYAVNSLPEGIYRVTAEANRLVENAPENLSVETITDEYLTNPILQAKEISSQVKGTETPLQNRSRIMYWYWLIGTLGGSITGGMIGRKLRKRQNKVGLYR